MLSYQHIYHAGNPADVQKHMLLAWILSYLMRKDKPISYIETHSGRGLYHLDAAEALKTGEAKAGIGKLLKRGDLADQPLMVALARIRAEYGPQSYPGSPMIAAQLMRPGDKMHLAELHPQEHAALALAMKGSGAKVYKQNGYEMIQSICPPIPRRGMLLIDPSYETSEDYARMPARVASVHRKWNVGIIAIWYPLLTSGAHRAMIKGLNELGLPGVFCHEVRFPPVREGHRMTGSGMYVINAPYGIEAAASEITSVFGP